MFKPMIFHEHVNLSGIVLIHHFSLSLQCNLLFNALMHSVEPLLMVFVLIGYTPASLCLSFESRCVGIVTTKSSPCVIPETRCHSCRHRFFELSPNCYLKLLRCSCQSLSLLLAASRVRYMLLFNDPICAAPTPVLSSIGRRTWFLNAMIDGSVSLFNVTLARQ